MLIKNWKEIAKKAWSMRLMYLSFALGICELAVQFLPIWRGVIPPGVFGVLSALAQTGAMIGRVMKQRGFPDD